MHVRRSELLFNTNNRPTSVFGDFLKDIRVPGDNLADINEELQRRFFQKKPGTNEPLERWELGDVGFPCPPARFRRYLDLCGFGLATIPQQWRYGYAAWPGALLVRAAARLIDLIEAWESGVRWKEIIVLGGKRPLQQDRETPQAAASLLGRYYYPYPTKPQTLGETELDMMRWLWVNCMRSLEMLDMPVVFVDAPMKPPATPGGQPVRPNTEDTIREWLKDNPWHGGSLLLSSGAPYGMAQDEVLWRFLEPRRITVETFGHAAPDLAPEVFMREVAGTVHQITLSRNS